MTEQLRYNKAPITEAVIDIRVHVPDDLHFEALSGVQMGQEERYPEKRHHVVGQVSFGPEVEASQFTAQNGYVFADRDGHWVFQVRLDGFAFSQVGSYDRWEPFRDEARRLWTLYRAIAHPTAITRLAVRYVNRLDLPPPAGDLQDYFRTVPEISEAMPFGAVSGYLMHLEIPQPDLEAMLLLNQALVPPPDEETVSVVLDIDLFRDTDVPDDEEEIWRLFELFRTRKNEVFRASITDVTEELIR